MRQKLELFVVEDAADLAPDLSVLERWYVQEAEDHPGSMGDRISLPRSMEAATTASVAREFGDAFADELSDLPREQWSGPVTSGLGVHLVKLRDMAPARQKTFEEVRLEVERDWRAEMRMKAEEEAYAIMRANYDIQIEGVPQRKPLPGGVCCVASLCSCLQRCR